MGRLLSLPHEHGAWLTLVGGAVAAAAISPLPWTAVAAGGAFGAGFLSRGPLDRRAAGAAWRPLDGAALVVAGVALVVLSLVAALPSAVGVVAIGAAALSYPALSFAARRTRRHRQEIIEIAGMCAVGASAALAALVGHAAWSSAGALGAVLGAHAGASVPLVRAELRARERHHSLRSGATALAIVGAGVLVLAVIGRAAEAWLLLPRAIQAAERGLRGPVRSTPAATALRESALLALVLVLVVAWARALQAGGS